MHWWWHWPKQFAFIKSFKSALDTCQVTFIFCVTIQILSFGSLFLVSLLVLGNAPHIASVATHDILSHITGHETATSASLKWLLKHGKTNDPTSTSKLALAILLLLSYSLFTKLTDVGLISLYACTTPGPNFLDAPTSAHSDDCALEVLHDNMVNGTDPSIVRYFCCDAVEPFILNTNDTLSVCTVWTNLTYGNKSLSMFELNGYFMGPLFQHISMLTILNGIAVIPHNAGFHAFLGAPGLSPYTQVTLPQTIVLEANIGCMTVGMLTEADVYSIFSNPIDVFYTNDNGPWRKYAGPDYLQDVVSKTVDNVHAYLKPLWNMSTLDPTTGSVMGINASDDSPTSTTNIQSYFLPSLPGADSWSANVDASDNIFRNCSECLESQLNISIPHMCMIYNEMLCGLMGIGGLAVSDVRLYIGLLKMVCATVIQVNLIHVDIEVDGNGNINSTFKWLPSELHTTMADYWNAHPVGVMAEMVSDCVTSTGATVISS
ncbi:hypothetical protein P691DRAFT_764687 [Macrolepiota fuliginosa MF-IS2]|uniref:Uncharacterized protein n=1 Tax=Macrolepiota fuliginosa MF-IS2 TaxID=1400762 RepID=A0A9P5X421_9AGAR|nr:hypothetical protein P691DRAFT_764687 [Macrolepiota fuliginosa MF-IS2]